MRNLSAVLLGLSALLSVPVACSTADPEDLGTGRAALDKDDDDDDGGRPDGAGPKHDAGRPADPGCGLICSKCTVTTDCCNPLTGAYPPGSFAPVGTQICDLAAGGTCRLLDAGPENCVAKGKCCRDQSDCCDAILYGGAIDCVNGTCR